MSRIPFPRSSTLNLFCRAATRVSDVKAGEATLTLSDFSRTALFDSNGIEKSAQALKAPAPQLIIDISRQIRGVDVPLPALNDKVQCMGYLDKNADDGQSDDKSSPRISDYVLRCISYDILEELDIASWNQASRKISAYILFHPQRAPVLPGIA